MEDESDMKTPKGWFQKICESLEGAPRDQARTLAHLAFTPLIGP